MQPGSQPEDIHTILSRFHTWTGKNPGNGKGGKLVAESDAVREIPYEEAMRNFRQRRKTQPRRATAAASPSHTAALSVPSEPVAENPKDNLVTARATTSQAEPDTPPEAKAETTAIARRSDAFCETATTVLPSRERKPAGEKPGGPTKKAPTQSVALAVLPVQPKPLRVVQAKPSGRSKPEPRGDIIAKKSVAPLVRPHAANPKKPAFKKVLAKTVRSAAPADPGPRETIPADRNRRITTRFSAAEQRRLERAAAQAGLTVSAWVRQCALHAETASAPPPAKAAKSAPVRTAKAAVSSHPAGSTLFSTPAPSGVGNWLTLLRQRFLSSPARFSERA
jgi:hypothetical protein